MKICLILCLASVLVSCQSRSGQTSLTGAQAIALAAQHLPPQGTNSAYTATLANGYWEIYVIPATEKEGIVDFSLATNVWHSVATVRDSNGKVEIIR